MNYPLWFFPFSVAMTIAAGEVTGKAELYVATSSVAYLTQPALCPTRPEVAFISGGDIWIAPARGGTAKVLVSNPADESRPLYSPDGTRLAFVSDRTGNGDIYVLTIATGVLKRLTFDDAREQLDGWSRDGRWIYFSTSRYNLGGMDDIYRISADGGTPMPVSDERYVNQYQAAPAPDGGSMAFAARGWGDRQWWRKGHSHLDESEIWLRSEGSPAKYERLVDLNGRNAWPMWMPDSRTLYFMSDRSGAQNLWTLRPGSGARQVTHFTSGRLLWPSIGYDGKEIVFEHDFKLWKLDTRSGSTTPLNVSLSAATQGPGVTHLTLNRFNDLAVSPDGAKLALVSRGEVFLASTSGRGEVARITDTAGPESEIEWSPDSSRIVYIGERGVVAHVYLYDVASRRETQLTRDALPDRRPHFSPDGQSVAFERDYRELRVMSLAGRRETLVSSADLRWGDYAWSPDGAWLAYLAGGEGALRNAYVASSSGGTSHQVSFLPNSLAGFLRWSPNGRFLMFQTGQRTEQPQIARILLAPSGARGPVFEKIRERTAMLPLGMAAMDPRISPDGKSVVFTSTAGGHENLYLYPVNDSGWGTGSARQLTSTDGFKANVHFSSDSRRIYYLDGGQVKTLTGGRSSDLAFTARMDVNFHREKIAVFQQAWSVQRDWFYDPKMNGADWNEVYRRYLPVVRATRTPQELRAVLRLMVGELNASHSGVYSPANRNKPIAGQLGLSFDRALYESTGRMRVTAVLPGSPAASAKIQTGDELEAVDGIRTGAHVNLDALLQNKFSTTVTLNVSGRHVTVQPVAALAARRYQKWVEDNRAYVLRASGGRLGYVHMKDMSAESLGKLYMDLDADNRAKDGIVIDIRNNDGGFVNSYALDVLARHTYLLSSARNGPAGSDRTVQGQRALDLPTILVVNQHTLSDGEDFTEGYRAMHLGRIVGEPTSGWIIGTSPWTLIDGSIMRVPLRLMADREGRSLENHPRPVDDQATRPIGESFAGHDSQLDLAVSKLLAQIGGSLKLPAIFGR